MCIVEEDEQRIDPAITKILIIVVIGLIGFIAVSLFFQYNPGQSTTHPPQVGITRVNDDIKLTYLGGIDDGFVGDFRVKYSDANGKGNTTTTAFKKPSFVNVVFGTLHSPNITCVDVDAFDKAVQSFRPIGHNCL